MGQSHWRQILHRLRLLTIASLLLGGCTSPAIQDVQEEVPVSDLREFIYPNETVKNVNTIKTLYLLISEDTAYVNRLAWTVVLTSNRYDVPPQLVASIIVVESYLDSAAYSVAGAVGLMQVIPSWWLGVYPECGESLWVPETNICYGTKILSWYIEYFDHRILRALNGYSGGAYRYGAKVLSVLGMFHLLEMGGLPDEHGPHILNYVPL